MFGSEILDVATGMALLFLLLSLVCSAIREAIEAFLLTRSMHLERGIRELLADPKGRGLAKALYEHPLICGLYTGNYEPDKIRRNGFMPAGLSLPSYSFGAGVSALIGWLITALATEGVLPDYENEWVSGDPREAQGRRPRCRLRCSRREMRAAACSWTVVMLVVASLPAAAQTADQRAIAGSVALGQFRRLLGSCDTVPELRALSGGGVQKLEPDRVMRLPYGVPYQFRHRVNPATDFVLVSLAVGSERETVQAVPLADDADCYAASIPPLPINQTVTLIEQIGEQPTLAQRSAMLSAIAELRRRFIERLYAGQYNAGILNHRLRDVITADLPNLLDTTSLGGFVVRDSLALISLIDIVVTSFSDAATGLTELPAAVIQLSAFARNLGTIASSPSVCEALTITDRAILRGLANRIQSVREIDDPAQIALLYSEDGPLPVPAGLTLAAEGALRRGCAGHVRFDEFLVGAALLQGDPLRPVIEALRAARTLIERSFTLTSTDVFPGATTTLQRFGQLDVVNGYLRGRDEVRLLASFSFYPARSRYGAEIRPYDIYDRIVLSVGYSVATAASDSSDDARDRRIFTAGGGFRINDFFSAGAGQWFDGREHDWYFSFSGDLGGLPFLRNLFARKPEDQ